MYVFLIGVLLCLISLQTQGGNVADYAAAGARCTATRPDCSRAIDGIGVTTSRFYHWTWFGEPVGNSITITFTQSYTLYTARFLQLFWDTNKNFKDIDLEFQDGSTQQVTLTTDIAAWLWDQYTLSPPVTTNIVKITILTSPASTADNNSPYSGFAEVEFYNDLPATTTGVTTTSPSTTTPSTTTPSTTSPTTTIPSTTTPSTTTPSTTTPLTTTPLTTTPLTTTSPTTTPSTTTPSTTSPTTTIPSTTTPSTTTPSTTTPLPTTPLPTTPLPTTPLTTTPSTTTSSTTTPSTTAPLRTTPLTPNTQTSSRSATVPGSGGTQVSGGLNTRDVIISVSVSLCTLVVIAIGVACVCFMWHRSQLEKKKTTDAPKFNDIASLNTIPMEQTQTPGYQALSLTQTRPTPEQTPEYQALNLPQTRDTQGQSRPTTAVYENVDVSEYQEIDERQ